MRDLGKTGTRVWRGAFTAMAFAILFPFTGVNAQEPEEGVQRVAPLDVIVTTARQRAESLQDIPVVATILNKQALERYAISDLEEIAQATPNLIIGKGSSGGGPTLYIRGVGSNSGSAGFSPAVGLVIDGVFYARSRFVDQGFFDMEQVEVLKGPQALYFGKNNSAGLISIRTADPGDEFEASASLGYEIEAEEIIAEAMVSGPISDKFGMRLAVRYSDMEGWLKNVAGPLEGFDPLGFTIPGTLNPNQPNEDELLGRLTMRLTPNDRLEATLKVQGARNTDDNRLIGAQMIVCRGPNNTPQVILGVPDPFDDCKKNFTYSVTDYPAELFAGEPEEFRDGEMFTVFESFNASLEIDYEWDNITLNSVTGYIWYNTEYVSNADFSATGQIPFYENNSYEAWSQEIRAVSTFDGPVNFLLGVFYSDVDLDVRNSSRVAPLPPDSTTGRYFSWDKSSTTQEKTWSIYGEIVWDITDRLELAAGARYTDEKKDFLFTPNYIHEIFILLGAFDPRSIPGQFKEDNISPQASLTWRLTDDVTLFGAYKQGFKSGGLDNSHIPGVGFADSDLEFESEEAEGFEIGAKTEWFNSRLRLNLAFYRYDFKNLQVQQLNPVTTLFFIDNAAKARTTGVEAEFTWVANDQLSLNGGVAYNRGRYRDYTPGCYAGQTVEAGCTEAVNPATGLPTQTDRSGQPLVNAPEWLLNLGFVYEMPIANGWSGVLTGDARYSSDYLIDEAGAPGAFQDDYVLLNASARVYTSNNQWEFAVIGRNLTNQAVATGGFERALTGGGTGLPAAAGMSIPSDYVGIIQRGREVMFQVTWRWN